MSKNVEKQVCEEKIRKIVKRHLKQMVREVQMETMTTIDNYENIICDAYADRLFQCFLPFMVKE